MIAEDLIDRLAHETTDRLQSTLRESGREGRRRALSLIQECRVLLTEDGRDTWEEVFDSPPTIAQLMTRAGPEAFVVSIAMQRRTVRERLGLRIAAE